MTDSKKMNRKGSGKTEKEKSASKRKKSGTKGTGYEQIIFRDWCKACGICSAFCPKHVIGRDEAGAPVVERPEDCIGCRFCEIHCPDFAITVKEREAESERDSS